MPTKPLRNVAIDDLGYRLQRLITGGNTITKRGAHPERFPDFAKRVLKCVHALCGASWLDRAEGWYHFREAFADNRDEMGRFLSLQSTLNRIVQSDRKMLEDF